MTIELQELHVAEIGAKKVVGLRVSGKLEKHDYELFVPKAERLIEQYGKIRILMFLEDFLGWTMSGFWQDFKFDFKHFSDIERVAIVGDRKWEKRMATFYKPFTAAQVKYFDHTQVEQARHWIEQE